MSKLQVHIDLVKDPETGIEIPEIWKDIPGFEGYYQVSNYGRIKSLSRKVNRDNWGKYPGTYTVREKLLSPNLANGYLQVNLIGNKVKKMISIHRLVAGIFVPNPKDKPDVNHKDGVKSHNFYLNLEWCTPQENSIHASQNNLMPKGEGNGSSVLTRDEVLEIKKHAEKKGSRYGRKKLSQKYGVSEETIKQIVNGRAWGHV